VECRSSNLLRASPLSTYYVCLALTYLAGERLQNARGDLYTRSQQTLYTL
jgi:hypothetical protein